MGKLYLCVGKLHITSSEFSSFLLGEDNECSKWSLRLIWIFLLPGKGNTSKRRKIHSSVRLKFCSAYFLLDLVSCKQKTEVIYLRRVRQGEWNYLLKDAVHIVGEVLTRPLSFYPERRIVFSNLWTFVLHKWRIVIKQTSCAFWIILLSSRSFLII